uniref:glycerophosphodiester phosphodiesterase n=1 Tax=Cannabis sativa TaxID=3483 RepID=A0A803P9M2_CANSA
MGIESSREDGIVMEKRVTELSLSEFLCYGPQKEVGKEGKHLLRKSKDGNITEWNVETDDSLCTLQEAFEQVEPSLGFNIELKFDDSVLYQQDYLIHVLQAILDVVFGYAKGRSIIFSSFQSDAALLVKKLQDKYPVYFLTNGGTEIFLDVRRNSRSHEIVLGSNVSEAVYIQHLMGIDGVIVDLVQEITEAVFDLMKPTTNNIEEESLSQGDDENIKLKTKPQFSQKELSFLLKLIPQLIQI